MNKIYFYICELLLMVAVIFFVPAFSAAYLLDADSLTVGTYTSSAPLIISTPYGNVSFIGEIRDPDSDQEFLDAGASGNVFDIVDPDNESISDREKAYLIFSFDIYAATFIYGGNVGVFDIEAQDIYGNVIDNFYQADTDAYQPAGPVTLTGNGIRVLYWTDPGNYFAPIDNLDVSVPEPATLILLSLGLLGLAEWKRKS